MESLVRDVAGMVMLAAPPVGELLGEVIGCLDVIEFYEINGLDFLPPTTL